MALEDVLKAGSVYYNSISLANTYLNREGNLSSVPSNENLQELIDALFYDVDEGVREAHTKDIQSNLGLIPEMITANKKQGREELIRTSRKNYKELISRMDEATLVKFAFVMPDAKKKFYKILRKLNDLGEQGIKPEEGLDEKDLAEVKKNYAGTFESAAWRKFIEKQDGEFIAKYASQYVAIAQKRFIGNALSREETRDGKRVYVPDVSKIRRYLSERMESANEKEKEQAYFEAGKLYSLMELSKKKK